MKEIDKVTEKRLVYVKRLYMPAQEHMLDGVSELNEKSPSIFRYWAAGIVFLIVGWIALFPIMLFGEGFFGFLSSSYTNSVVMYLA